MHRYFFELGREPELSQAEIEAVLGKKRIANTITRTGSYAIIDTDSILAPDDLMRTLGGTLAIGELIPSAGASLPASILAHLHSVHHEKKVVFSLHGPNHLAIAKQVKTEAKEQGMSIRYVEPNNTATILHNDLLVRKTDLRIIQNQLFVTTAIQPITELSNRDFGRPGRDAMSGMLPPKLAKIMINLSESNPSSTILDPFCGSGTLLMEAALMGYTRCIGSDLSPKAIADSQKNLSWLQRGHDTPIPEVFVSDIRSLPQHIKPGSVGAIITEPFLGKPLRGNETLPELKKAAHTLLPLYRDIANTAHKLLMPGGTLVIAIPSFKHGSEWVRLPWQEFLRDSGFQSLPFSTGDFIRYARPNQHVGREIWRSKKSSSR